MNGNLQPEFLRCDMSHFDAVAEMYARAVRKLERTVNYPKWSEAHPSRAYIAEAIRCGNQFACIQNGAVLGAAVLSEDPEGSYDPGHWSRTLQQGDFLVIHVLAVDPAFERRGIGGFLVDQSIAYARAQGYAALRLDVVPENIPAVKLYLSRGFRSAGKSDLQRGLDFIPIFELYELNF